MTLTKLQRRKRTLKDKPLEDFVAAVGMDPDGLVEHLKDRDASEVSDWFTEHSNVVQLLDQKTETVGQRLIISEHDDEVRRVERGYGDATKPEDYLEGFKQFIDSNLNKIPALLVVTQRPRDLTRQQLRELKLELDRAGYTEAGIQTAWRETTNEDIAASIIGFIRQLALGSPLEPYEERIARAMKQVLASRAWTSPQRRWLERIGKQLSVETIVDKEALDRGQFKAQGGFQRINKVFDGQLEQVLGEIGDELWKDAG